MAHLEITFTKQKTTFRAALLTDDAPVTCKQLSSALAEDPIQGLSYHSIYSGQEFYVYCPAIDIPLENHVVWPKPGQILYYYFPDKMYAGMHVHKDRVKGAGAEIALWYGHGDLRVVSETGIRGNLFAEIVPEQLKDFYAAGDHVLAHGREDIVMTLVD